MLKIAIVDFQGISCEATEAKFVEQLNSCLTMNDEIMVYIQLTPSFVLVPLFQRYCYQILLTAKETYRDSKKISFVGVKDMFAEIVFESAENPPEYSYELDRVIELPSTAKLKYRTETDVVILNWILHNSDLIFTCHYKHVTLSRCNKILFQYMLENKEHIYNLTSSEIEDQIQNLIEALPIKEREIIQYYDLGWSYRKIGQIYSVSGSRIRQIIIKIHNKVENKYVEQTRSLL